MPSKKKEEVSQSSMSNVGSYQPVSMSGAGNGVDESFQDAWAFSELENPLDYYNIQL